MKYTTTDYTNPRKQVLRFPDHYVGLAVMLDNEGIVANSEGKKIIPAGTIIGGTGGANSIFVNQAIKATKHNTNAAATGAAGAGVDAEGVLYYDVDVTYGPAAGTMIIHGFINQNNLPEEPCADALKALSGRLVFLK